MSVNQDELVAPEWLDLEFVECALRKYKNNDSLSVLNFATKPGSNVGDHFASIMFRIVATITDGKSDVNEDVFLILKTMPFVEGIKKDFLAGTTLFDVEIKMYTDILPKMQPLMESCGIPKFWPKLVYQSVGPVPVVIFEDLSKDGFTVPQELFSLSLGKLLYSRLAAIHATSYYLHHEENEDFSGFNKSLFDLPQEATENFFGAHMDIFIKELETWPGYEVYVEKLKIFRQNFIAMGVTKCVPNAYNVLNHGDFHSKNILVKLAQAGTEHGEVVVDNVLDYVVLDYQISLWTSPGLDLIYSLFMMIHSDTRASCREELIKHYHDEFCAILKKLGFAKSIPTLDDLNKELEKFGFLEVVLSVCFLPFMFLDFTLITDVAEFMEGNDKAKQLKISLYKNEKYQQIMKKELPRFLKQGFMDV